jgi:hypothetical protein
VAVVKGCDSVVEEVFAALLAEVPHHLPTT